MKSHVVHMKKMCKDITYKEYGAKECILLNALMKTHKCKISGLYLLLNAFICYLKSSSVQQKGALFLPNFYTTPF